MILYVKNSIDADLLGRASVGDMEGVQAALSAGANIAAQQEDGLTALHLAIAMNDLPLARYLVEEARAPFVADGFGRLPTVVAAQCYVSEELSDYILEKEAAATADAK